MEPIQPIPSIRADHSGNDLHLILLLPALSTTLCASGSDEMDAAVDAMLRQTGEAVGVDRAALVEFDDNVGAVDTYEWTAPVEGGRAEQGSRTGVMLTAS